MRTHTILLATGIAAFLMMGMGQSVYGPALPAFTRALALEPGTASTLISAHWVGCGVGVALMFARGGRVAPPVALGLMAIGAALVALMPGLALTLAGALVFGAGYGAATVMINPRILQAFGQRGPAMVSLVNACFALGAIVAPMVYVWLGSDPALSYALVAVIAAAIAVLALGIPAAPAVNTVARGRFNPRPDLMVYPAVGIGLESLLIGLGPSALIAQGQSEDAAAGFLSLFFVGFLVARVGLIFIAHRIAPFTVYLAAVAGVAMLSALSVLTGQPWPFAAMGLCAGLFFPGFYVAATQVMGDDPRVPSVIIAAGLIGGIFLPLVIGPVLPHLGAAGFFALILALGGGATALGLWHGRRALSVPPATA
jgi:fucose permease